MSHKKMIIMMLDILLVLFFPIVTLGEDFGLNPEMDSDIGPDVIEIVISGEDTNKDKDEYKDENTNTNNTYLGIILPGYNGFQINGIFFRSVPSGGIGSGADLALIKTETNQIILPIGLQYYLGWPVLKVYGGFDILFVYKPFQWAFQGYVKVGLQSDIGSVGFFIQNRMFVPSKLDADPWSPSIYYEPEWEIGLVIRIR